MLNNTTSNSELIDRAISVFELNQLASEILDANFNRIAIKGEISNIATPRSGHIYFTLKDENAQIRCALFRQHRRNLAAIPELGDEVVLTAHVSIYSARGDYQLIVDNVFPVGDGQLQAIFQKLVKKLQQQGLFAAAHKQAIPKTPQCIGIVTSATGAALQDILKVLKRRAPSIKIQIFPATVQGESAAASLCAALKQAESSTCETIILGRGGGSAEDLWAFNDEKLAELIFACKKPIITGIGHEVDTTIADLVADQRAATPSAAAECASPDQRMYLKQLSELYLRSSNALESLLTNKYQALENLSWQLKQVSPTRKLEKMTIRLQGLCPRLTPAIKSNLQAKKLELNTLAQKLAPGININLEQKKNKFALFCASLNNLSPLQVLGRGYAMAEQDGKILQKKSDFKAQTKFKLHLQDGAIDCQAL